MPLTPPVRWAPTAYSAGNLRKAKSDSRSAHLADRFTSKTAYSAGTTSRSWCPCLRKDSSASRSAYPPIRRRETPLTWSRREQVTSLSKPPTRWRFNQPICVPRRAHVFQGICAVYHIKDRINNFFQIFLRHQKLAEAPTTQKLGAAGVIIRPTQYFEARLLAL